MMIMPSNSDITLSLILENNYDDRYNCDKLKSFHIWDMNNAWLLSYIITIIS